MITSLLDTDYYKFTMGQYVYKYDPNVIVEYSLINRKPQVLDLDFWLDIKEFFYYVRELENKRFSLAELAYLESLGFSRDYTNFLTTFKLPHIKEVSSFNDVKVVGRWPEAILWETFLMTIVSEMVGRNLGSMNHSAKFRKFKEKKKKLKCMSDRPTKPFTFADFGTRRRHSFAWQLDIVSQLSNEFVNFVGTSNVLLSKILGRKPVGTNAHELQMVAAAPVLHSIDLIAEVLLQTLNRWIDMYPEYVLLPDTFGTKFFLNNVCKYQSSILENAAGFRQDSGNPKTFTTFLENELISRHVDLKKIIYSDGLTINAMNEILSYMENSPVYVSFGWGTNLTNDVGGPAPSVVVKPTRMSPDGDSWYNVVKLSDDLSKATGDKDTIDALIDSMNKYKELK